MKSILLTFTCVISLNSFSYYEDNPEVITLADSGKAELYETTNDCKGKYPLRLGKTTGYQATCLSQIDLPLDVAGQIDVMKEFELENYSDYDSRVTELYMFNVKYGDANISLEKLKEVFVAFGVKDVDLSEIRATSELVDANSFDFLEYIFVGDTPDENSTEINDFLLSHLAGQNTLKFQITRGVELYPGGGFNVTYFLYLIDGKMVFLKNSWWDA